MQRKWLGLPILLSLMLALCPIGTLEVQAENPAEVAAQGANSSVTVIGFSDYHSKAVPFYSEGQQNQAGVARTLAYLKGMRQNVKNLLILSGGDTMNLGTPTWSDEYKCVEWPWFNGLIDAMALGNHDFDYGPADYEKCAAGAKYPLVSANYVDPTSKQPIFTTEGKPYLVKEVGGVKLGLFGMGASDFETLIKKESRYKGGIFADRIQTAQQVVKDLREKEKVDAVIYFGHSYREDDFDMASKVPGIDLILGTHSHYKGELTKIPNTNTWFISPFQYLTYLAQAELKFEGGKLASINGQLVKMDAGKPEDTEIAAQVKKLQADLETKRPERFQVLGQAAVELSDANISTDETVLGNWTMDVVREAAKTHAFFSTSSSFRAAIPPGPITVEKFFTAIPYKNSIVTGEMTGQQLTDIINKSLTKRTTDGFSQLSGVRFKVEGGKAVNLQIVNDPTAKNPAFVALEPAKVYKVGTTNFQALINADYKDLFAKASNLTDTKQDIGTLLTQTIQNSSPITAKLDGRMGTSVAAGQGGATMPASGVGGNNQPQENLNWLLLTFFLILVAASVGLGVAKTGASRSGKS